MKLRSVSRTKRWIRRQRSGEIGDVADFIALAQDAQEDLIRRRLAEVPDPESHDLGLPQAATRHHGEHDVVAVVGGPGGVQHARELVLGEDVVGRVLAHARALGEKAQSLGVHRRRAGHVREDQEPPEHRKLLGRRRRRIRPYQMLPVERDVLRRQLPKPLPYLALHKRDEQGKSLYYRFLWSGGW